MSRIKIHWWAGITEGKSSKIGERQADWGHTTHQQTHNDVQHLKQNWGCAGYLQMWLESIVRNVGVGTEKMEASYIADGTIHS